MSVICAYEQIVHISEVRLLVTSEVRLQVKWAYKWSELTSEVRLQVKCAYKQSA